jgi:hypothetical protein
MRVGFILHGYLYKGDGSCYVAKIQKHILDHVESDINERVAVTLTTQANIPQRLAQTTNFKNQNAWKQVPKILLKSYISHTHK